MTFEAASGEEVIVDAGGAPWAIRVIGVDSVRFDSLKVRGYTRAGIQLRGNGCEVRRCLITTGPSTELFPACIQVVGGSNYTRVLGNRLFAAGDLQIGVLVGDIYVDPSPLTARTRIVNNFICAAGPGADNWRFGVYLMDHAGTELLHNTILVGGGGTRNVCVLDIRDSGTTMSNNVLMTEAANSSTCYWRKSAGYTDVSDHNTFFPGQTGAQVVWHTPPAGAGGSYTLAQWQQLTGRDLHSLDANPRLVMGDPRDLHLTAESPCIGAGYPVGILFDIDGEWRATGYPPQGPSIGADERPAHQPCDLAVTAIPSPSGEIPLNSVVVPAIQIHDFGGVCMNSVLTLYLFGPGGELEYEDSVPVLNMVPGETRTMVLPNWTASPVGRHLARARIRCDGDVNPRNDTLSHYFWVIAPETLDAAAVSIDLPRGKICDSTPLQPRATVRNLSSTPQSFEVLFTIAGDPPYASTLFSPLLAPQEECHLVFESWTANSGGVFVTRCSTRLDGDINNANDFVTGSVTVLAWPAGWTRMAPVPLAPSGRTVRDGGWLAGARGDRYLYAAKGHKTPDFYAYDVDNNFWAERRPIPVPRNAELPDGGARGIHDGREYIYSTTGGNSAAFWRYSTSGDRWERLEDVPRVQPNQNVQWGSDLVYVTRIPGDTCVGDSGWVYLLKGYGREFYRYNVTTGRWELPLPLAPSNNNPLWKGGSFLTYDGDRTIYAHRGIENRRGPLRNELWTFDIVDSRWSTEPLAAMPGDYSHYGGCGDWFRGGIFSLKGGASREFYRYDALANDWRRLADFPKGGPSHPGVDRGGDILHYACRAFFALRGDMTDEFWRYVMPANGGGGGGQANGGPSAAVMLEVLSASPHVGDFAEVSYSVPGSRPASLRVVDVAGRVVRSRAVSPGSSRARMDLRGLGAGVYVLRCEADGLSTAARLLVLR
ncbi:hypothetical protein FJY71_02445 [candidate division WOR-3 bacterium]|nr:hypothetical protein [candidate division WOR-3 bacterium]